MPSTIDDVLVASYDKFQREKIYMRACRTPDRKHVVAAWALREEIHNLLPLDKGWEPPETPSPPLFEIVSIEAKGRGLIATRKIPKGEIIIRERPIVIAPKLLCPCPPDPSQPWLPMDKLLLQLVYWLEQDDRERFLQLHNCKPPDDCGPLTGIFRTNAVGACLFTPLSLVDYCVICLNISYANHSCSPSATYDFYQKTMTLELRATRDIEKGEEITISYVDPSMPKSDRQQELETKYCFTCDCTLCLSQTQPDPLKDAYRRFVNKVLDNVQTMWDDLLSSPPWSRAEKLKWNVETMELVLKAIEAVDMPEKRITVSQHLAWVYSLTSDLENFRIWARNCVKLLESRKDIPEWEQGSVYETWQEWYRNPKLCPSWGTWK